MESTKILTRTAEIWKDNNGIIHTRVLMDSIIDLDDVIDNILVIRSLCQETAHLKLIDSRNHWKITSEAKKFSEKVDSTKRTIARAILVSNKTDALLKNFFLKFNLPEIPSKLFTEEQKAIDWLHSFKK